MNIYFDGSEFVIETTGNPNHETVYWGVGHPLYKEGPNVNLTPSIIPKFDAPTPCVLMLYPSWQYEYGNLFRYYWYFSKWCRYF